MLLDKHLRLKQNSKNTLPLIWHVYHLSVIYAVVKVFDYINVAKPLCSPCVSDTCMTFACQRVETHELELWGTEQIFPLVMRGRKQ